jgi:hypothetical protein
MHTAGVNQCHPQNRSLFLPSVASVPSARVLQLCQNMAFVQSKHVLSRAVHFKFGEAESFNATMKIWILAHHIRCAGGQSPIVSVVIPTNPGW